MRELLPRRGEDLDRVEDAAEKGQRQDQDVVDEAVVVEALGVDPDDDAERREENDEQQRRDDQVDRTLDRDAGERQGDDDQRDPDRQRAEDAAEHVAEVHPPRLHRRGEDVVDVAVVAGLQQRRGVVREGGLGHRHRDQAGDDEDVVVEAVDLLDAIAEREAEDEDEERRGDDRREDRLRPQARHPPALAEDERPHRAGGIGTGIALCRCRRRSCRGRVGSAHDRSSSAAITAGSEVDTVCR